MDARLLVAGETLVDFLPTTPGPLETVSGFDRRPGGAPANVAVGLARLGLPPLFWTRVGNDPFGQYLEAVLLEEGIPTPYLRSDPDAQTSLAFVTHDETGDRTFSFYRDGTADTRLEPGFVEDETLNELEWVHAGGVTLASGRSRRATLELLERASARGCTVSFDPNVRPELWPSPTALVDVCREALTHVDILKATDDELESLGFDGDSTVERAQGALKYGPEIVYVTRGGAGALAVTKDGTQLEHEGYDVDVVDTTGAGDAFTTGLIAGSHLELTDSETLAFANRIAAEATTATGAMSALPTREDVRELADIDIDLDFDLEQHNE